MEIDERTRARFAELQQALGTVGFWRDEFGRAYAEARPCHKWCTSALNLLGVAFGETSTHYRNFDSRYDNSRPYLEEGAFDALCGIFMGAKEDYEGGYFLSVQRAVSGELFGDFVVLAKQSLNEGHKDVAAVLACAALEDALKRHALAQELDVQEKSMQEVVAALKTKGLVSGAQKALLDTMPKIRDYAMHANWEKIQPEDVRSVIGFVDEFLLRKFSD